ncbi:MAG: DoxX family membrane protein [Chloroflexi bacterium]|nr:DoxX family membrane protein [Chloroflexota bacterium]MBV9893156.1 DoxX family membrane protein [Chloroflexota bacterium]
MFKVEKVTDTNGRVWIQDPPIARFLFQGTLASWFWLVVRVYVGYDFLTAGWHKFTTPEWMNGTGAGIIGFWKGALGTTASGAPVITFDWYRNFLQFLLDTNSAGWFSYVIVFGELAVGIGLILGAFVGLAATGGLLMNMAFMLAGTTSTNPVLAILGVLLILAWKNAGYIGLDRYLLPLFGTPWKQAPPVPAKIKVTAVPAAASR